MSPVGEAVLVGVSPGAELERGAHHHIIESISQWQQPDGTLRTDTNQVMALATGMFYDEEGLWRPSREEIEVGSDCAVAQHGPYKVVWPLELGNGSEETVEIVAPDHGRFRSRLLGLRYYDPVSGGSAWLAGVKPSRAELLPPNRLIYRDAFDGPVTADVVFEYHRGSVAQGFFANAVGDFLLQQSGEISGNGDLFLVHFNGSGFDSMVITDDEPRVLEHAVFAPLSLPINP